MKEHLTPEQRIEIGRAVIKGREGRVCWKVLARLYRRSKAQLRRYVREVEAMDADDAPNETH